MIAITSCTTRMTSPCVRSRIAGVNAKQSMCAALGGQQLPLHCTLASPHRVLLPPPTTTVHRSRPGRLVVRAVSSPQKDDVRPVIAPPNLTGAIPWAIALITASLIAAFAGIAINEYGDAICNTVNTEQPFKPCTDIPLFMTVPLVATHLLAFGLMPTAMFVTFTRAPQLKRWGAKDPFMAITGLSMLMVSIAGEIGWHVTQHWYYQDEYMILNAFFYCFLVLGTALWAVGIQDQSKANKELNKKIDLALYGAMPLAMTSYYLAAAGVLPGKFPIYIILSLEYAVLSYRLWRLLEEDNRVWFFPFFSVGVNLFFIFLLSKYESNIILNPLFHICHDALGTELGVAIITSLLWIAPNRIGTIDQPAPKKLPK